MPDAVFTFDPNFERSILNLPGAGEAAQDAAQRIGARAKQLAGRAENRRAGAYLRSLHVQVGRDSGGRWAAVVATRHAIVVEYGWTDYRTHRRYPGKKILGTALRESRYEDD